jgi:hypothetical protein
MTEARGHGRRHRRQQVAFKGRERAAPVTDGAPDAARSNSPVPMTEAGKRLLLVVEGLVPYIQSEAREPLEAELIRLRRITGFLADRLVYVYGESPNIDFILAARLAILEPGAEEVVTA